MTSFFFSLIDIFTFAPAWQNKMLVGSQKLKNLDWELTDLCSEYGNPFQETDYPDWKILQSWFTWRCFVPNSDNSSNMQKLWYKMLKKQKHWVKLNKIRSSSLTPSHLIAWKPQLRYLTKQPLESLVPLGWQIEIRAWYLVTPTPID